MPTSPQTSPASRPGPDRGLNHQGEAPTSRPIVANAGAPAPVVPAATVVPLTTPSVPSVNGANDTSIANSINAAVSNATATTSDASASPSAHSANTVEGLDISNTPYTLASPGVSIPTVVAILLPGLLIMIVATTLVYRAWRKRTEAAAKASTGCRTPLPLERDDPMGEVGRGAFAQHDDDEANPFEYPKSMSEKKMNSSGEKNGEVYHGLSQGSATFVVRDSQSIQNNLASPGWKPYDQTPLPSIPAGLRMNSENGAEGGAALIKTGPPALSAQSHHSTLPESTEGGVRCNKTCVAKRNFQSTMDDELLIAVSSYLEK